MAWNTFIEQSRVSAERIFYFFADIVFPPKDVEKMTTEEFARLAPPSRDSIEGGVKFLWNYRTPLVKRAIWEMKFRGNRKVAHLLASALYRKLEAEISSGHFRSNTGKILLVPIPMSKARRREKGFNQVEILLEEIISIDKNNYFQLEKDALFKTKETARQVSIKNRENRLRNLFGAFDADSQKVSGKIIFLVDDVTTTGATLSEAKKTLRDAGSKKVFCFALAH